VAKSNDGSLAIVRFKGFSLPMFVRKVTTTDGTKDPDYYMLLDKQGNVKAMINKREVKGINFWGK